MCTINEDHIWNVRCNRQKFSSFRDIFCPFSPLTTCKIKILTLELKHLERYHFTHLHHKWQSYVWFLFKSWLHSCIIELKVYILIKLHIFFTWCSFNFLSKSLWPVQWLSSLLNLKIWMRRKTKGENSQWKN